MGEEVEASEIDGRLGNPLDIGTNGVPLADLIERGVKDSTDRLDRDIGEFALGLQVGEGDGEKILFFVTMLHVVTSAHKSIISPTRRRAIAMGRSTDCLLS